MNEDCARSLKYLKVRGQKARDCNLLCACLCIFQTNMLLEEAKSRQRSATAQATPPQTELGDYLLSLANGEPSQVPGL